MAYPSYTISGILPRVAAKLNDARQANYTPSRLMPFVQDAVDELQTELEKYGIQVLETIFDPISIPAGTTELTYDSTPALPANLNEPQRVEERQDGSTDTYVKMIRRQWEPDYLPTDTLRYWTYRDQAIYFLGSTQDREIKIYGLKTLGSPVTVNDSVTVTNSKTWMINRVAGLAARFIGEDDTRADALDKVAEYYKNNVIQIGVKSKQGTRTRRRPFVVVGRRRWV